MSHLTSDITNDCIFLGTTSQDVQQRVNDTKIVGGYPAARNQIPYQVKLLWGLFE